jgi:hypothetical protein
MRSGCHPLVVASAIALSALAGCGSSSSTSATVDAGNGLLVPPAPPNGPTTSVTAQHAYAIHRLYLGSSARLSPTVLDPTVWASFGYDLDGKVTTATSTDVCTPYGGAMATSQIDGMGGIDNSFGENIVPILLAVAGKNVEALLNASLDAGAATDLFVVKGWDDANATQTATGLGGVLLPANEYPTSPPSWTIVDHWPIDDAYLTPSAIGTDPIANANLKLMTSYVVRGEFVNGTRVDVPIVLEVSGSSLPLLVHHAIITWQNAGTGHIREGTIAGILTTSELIAGVLSSSYGTDGICNPQGPPSVVGQLSQASDILRDGSNVAGVPCDGISIGLGFDADEVAIPVSADVTAAPPGPPDPCATDAGD